MMVGRIVGYQYDALDARDGVRMRLERRVPEVFRIVLLAGEEGRLRRCGVGSKGERERDFYRRTVGALCSALEVEHVKVADAGCTKRLRIGRRALTFEHQH